MSSQPSKAVFDWTQLAADRSVCVCVCVCVSMPASSNTFSARQCFLLGASDLVENPTQLEAVWKLGSVVG